MGFMWLFVCGHSGAFSVPFVEQNCEGLEEHSGETLLQLSSVHALLANVLVSDC